MTKKQLKLYSKITDFIKKSNGFKLTTICGHDIEFDPNKGTWYVQGFGYLDDLVSNDEAPEFLIIDL